jgi:hypothetical protein
MASGVIKAWVQIALELGVAMKLQACGCELSIAGSSSLYEEDEDGGWMVCSWKVVSTR